MGDKINLAKIKKFGKTFEISIDPNKALQYKQGEITDIEEVLLADKIFTEAKKGLVASSNELQAAFQTTDISHIADIILKRGEIQATTEHRSQEREQQRHKLIYSIHIQAIDPRTGLPHSLERIEAALEQGKINLDYNKSIGEQFDDIISKLRLILPLKIEQKKMTLTIPAKYIGKAYPFVKSNSKFLNENWTNEGNWCVVVEVPAGFQQEFIDSLNSITHGELIIE